MTETTEEIMRKIDEIVNGICQDMGYGNMAPMIMPYVLQDPERTVRLYKKIKRIVNR